MYCGWSGIILQFNVMKSMASYKSDEGGGNPISGRELFESSVYGANGSGEYIAK